MWSLLPLSVILFGSESLARNIVFPPIHPFSGQAPFVEDDAEYIDVVSRSQFSGLSTFANVPYVNCFVDAEAEKQKYDIAILGAPFDTVCVVTSRTLSLRNRG